jgi:hypothetical protein
MMRWVKDEAHGVLFVFFIEIALGMIVSCMILHGC